MKRRNFLQTSITAAVAASLPGGAALAAAIDTLSKVSGDTMAVTGGGQEIMLEKAAVQELSEQLRGRLLLPGQEGYDNARRVLNASIDKHPALIVQPTGAADIRSAVNFARERELLLAVKCGGHSFSGKSTCDNGMQIDLSSFRSARVDPASRTAYISGGSHLGELDHEAMAFGLVTTAGTVSHTGVGGLTLGGGFGRLGRRFGLALDNVKAVEIVTADGNLLRASATEHPDLYWGVRGGGGNFGIVTSFEFDLHPMQRQVIGGNVIFPLSQIRDIVSFYADFAPGAPDDLYLDLIMASQAGSSDGVVILNVCYSGPEDQAEKVLSPIRKAGTPVQDGLAAVDYVALQRSSDNSDPRSFGQYMKSGFINEFPDKLVDTIVENYEAVPERGTFMFFQHSGGAIGQVPASATAFAHRKSMASMFAAVEWPLAESQDEHVAYIREFWNDFEPFTDGWYTNEVSDEPAGQVNRNYQGNFERLVQVKNQYDPGNLFRLNANVRPTV
jgi:FAD/FMN-containing dehydrogenase